MTQKSEHLLTVQSELTDTYKNTLNLPEKTLTRTDELLDRVVEAGLTQSRCYKTVIAATAYLAAREQNIPRVAEDFANATLKNNTPLNPQKLRQEARKIKRELGLQIKPTPTVAYLNYYATKLNATDETRETAHKLLDVADTHGISNGPAPTSLAAGVLDAARRLTNDDIIQTNIADVSHVSTAQLREYCQDIQNAST